MKTATIAYACMIVFSTSASASMFSLKSIKLPLWYNGEDEKGIQILNVPKVRMATPGEWMMIDLFDDPFEQYDPRHPVAGNRSRAGDLNMIYAYGIKTLAVHGDKTNPDKPLKLLIDISHAEKSNSFSIMEVARAAAVCVRDLFPKSAGVPLLLKKGDNESEFEPPFETSGSKEPSPEEPAGPSTDDKPRN